MHARLWLLKHNFVLHFSRDWIVAPLFPPSSGSRFHFPGLGRNQLPVDLREESPTLSFWASKPPTLSEKNSTANSYVPYIINARHQNGQPKQIQVCRVGNKWCKFSLTGWRTVMAAIPGAIPEPKTKRSRRNVKSGLSSISISLSSTNVFRVRMQRQTDQTML